LRRSEMHNKLEALLLRVNFGLERVKIVSVRAINNEEFLIVQ